jgi:hypothetical protein
LSNTQATVIPIRILATSKQLKGFTIKVTYDHEIVKQTACEINDPWSGGCNTNVDGIIEITGVNATFPSLAVVEVASISLQAQTTMQGVVATTITGTIVDIRVQEVLENQPPILENTPFTAGNIPILADTGLPTSGGRRLMSYRRSQADRRLQEAISGTLYGDTNGDGKFALSDLLFIQEYYNLAAELGCPTSGGIACTRRENITLMQLKQLALMGAGTNGARNIPYVIGVFLGNLYFVANVSITSSTDTIDANVRILDQFNAPVSNADQALILFVFNSLQQNIPWTNAANASYDIEKQMSLAYASPCISCSEAGWFNLNAQATGNNTVLFNEANVGIGFAIENMQGFYPSH